MTFADSCLERASKATDANFNRAYVILATEDLPELARRLKMAISIARQLCAIHKDGFTPTALYELERDLLRR